MCAAASGDLRFLGKLSDQGAEWIGGYIMVSRYFFWFFSHNVKTELTWRNLARLKEFLYFGLEDKSFLKDWFTRCHIQKIIFCILIRIIKIHFWGGLEGINHLSRLLVAIFWYYPHSYHGIMIHLSYTSIPHYHSHQRDLKPMEMEIQHQDRWWDQYHWSNRCGCRSIQLDPQ